MFRELIEYFKTLENFKGVVENNIIVLTNHFQEETPRLTEIFKNINKKYNYDNYEHLVDIPTLDTHVEFWRGSGEYDLAVLLASLNGVYDPDPEFGRFYDQYKSCDMKKFQEYENDYQADLFYELQYSLFYTWIAFIWQDLNKNLGGFPVKVIENNASTIFNLIDFAWFDNSKYHDFLEQPKRREMFFKRQLSISEIYSRVNIKHKYDLVCSRTLIKENSKVDLKINNEYIKVSDGTTNQTIFEIKIEARGYKNSILYVEKHNELINDNWIDITFNGK